MAAECRAVVVAELVAAARAISREAQGLKLAAVRHGSHGHRRLERSCRLTADGMYDAVAIIMAHARAVRDGGEG